MYFNRLAGFILTASKKLRTNNLLVAFVGLCTGSAVGCAFFMPFDSIVSAVGCACTVAFVLYSGGGRDHLGFFPKFTAAQFNAQHCVYAFTQRYRYDPMVRCSYCFIELLSITQAISRAQDAHCTYMCTYMYFMCVDICSTCMVNI